MRAFTRGLVALRYEAAYRRRARRSGEVVCYEGDYAYHDSTAAGIHDGDKCPRCGAAV